MAGLNETIVIRTDKYADISYLYVMVNFTDIILSSNSLLTLFLYLI